jgi:foldase protein PrsA
MRMRPLVNKTLSVVVAAGFGLVGAGCGDDDTPSDAVAKVGEVVIDRSEFDKWFRVVALSPFLEGGEFVTKPPNPPSFSNCVAIKRAQVPPTRRDELSVEQLRRRCAREYDKLKRSTMHTLITTEWVQQEAAARNVTVSDKEVALVLQARKHGGFRSDDGFRQFLRDSGTTEGDIKFITRIQRLQAKVEDAITREASKLSDDDIARYYEKNKQRFSEPERRELTFVLTNTRAGAQEARQALEEGRSWRDVVRTYSADPKASRAQAVRTSTPAKGLESLEQAVFRARRGAVYGPVQTDRGWYVFTVTKVRAESVRTLGKVRDTIADLLGDQREAEALEAFHDEYRGKTSCAAGFKVPECGDGPLG